MATKSFMKEFAVDKQNVNSALRALNRPKPIAIRLQARANDIKKSQIKKFFGVDE